MNKPRSFEEVQTMLTQLESRLAKIETQDIDLHGRKVVNTAGAVSKTDYANLNDVLTNIANEISKLSTGSTDKTSSSSDLFILKSLPTLKLKLPGATIFTRFGIGPSDSGFISINLYYDGVNWHVDDVGKIGVMVYLNAGAVNVYTFPIGGAITTNITMDVNGLNVLVGNFKAAGVNGESTVLTYLTGTPAAGQSSKTVTFSKGIEIAHT